MHPCCVCIGHLHFPSHSASRSTSNSTHTERMLTPYPCADEGAQQSQPRAACQAVRCVMGTKTEIVIAFCILCPTTTAPPEEHRYQSTSTVRTVHLSTAGLVSLHCRSKRTAGHLASAAKQAPRRSTPVTACSRRHGRFAGYTESAVSGVKPKPKFPADRHYGSMRAAPLSVTFHTAHRVAPNQRRHRHPWRSGRSRA